MAVIEIHNAGELNTAAAARVMRIVVPELVKRGVRIIDYVGLGRAIMEKSDSMPTATASEVASAILDARGQ